MKRHPAACLPPARGRAAFWIACAALLGVATSPPLPAAAAEPEVGLTVYSSADPARYDPFATLHTNRHAQNWVHGVPGFGVVRDVRRIPVQRGQNRVDLSGVARWIDPTTVRYEDLTDPAGTVIASQAFLFDLVDVRKLYDRHLGRQVTVRGKDSGETVTGELLAVDGGRLILQTPEGLRLVPADGEVRFGGLPEGLITRPTLRLELTARRAGEHRLRTTYQTRGITWRADYGLVLDASEKKGALTGWVSLLNGSGRAYPAARVQLVAGEVQNVSHQDHFGRGGGIGGLGTRGVPQEEALFEYHLYTLPEPLDVGDASVTQVPLLAPVDAVAIQKEYVYFGADLSGGYPAGRPMMDRDVRLSTNTKVDVYLGFDNTSRNGLGRPLPRGRLRVYKADSEGLLQFVGEDVVDHTPRDERVKTRLGHAFDVVGERTQTEFVRFPGRNMVSESFRIQLRNAKDEAVKVTVRERLYRGANWEITETSHPWEKQDVKFVHIPIEVPARGSTTVTYTVQYTW